MPLKLKGPEAKSKGRKAEAAAANCETLVQKVSAAVVQYMRERHLTAGDTLPSEAEIAEELKVSRTVVREAFGALAALKLIDVGSGRRARVGTVDHLILALPLEHALHTGQMTVQHIWDARRALEVRAAELAANRRTDEEARAMVARASAMRKSMAHRAEMTQHDIALHTLIAQATRNGVFHTIIASFGAATQGAIAAVDQPNRENTELIVSLHERLAQTVADRDAAGAAAAMNEHFYTSLRVLVEAGFY
ncbi:MAG: FCD domain-containing protein [Rhodospirillaceae bacterium]|nr:FCD domain-containing protein [Rhodospirillaceae bacterium]